MLASTARAFAFRSLMALIAVAFVFGVIAMAAKKYTPSSLPTGSGEEFPAMTTCGLSQQEVELGVLRHPIRVDAEKHA